MSIPFPLHSLFSENHSANHLVCHDGTRPLYFQAFRHHVAGIALTLRQRPETRWLLTTADPQRFAILLFALLHASKQVVMPPNTQPGTLTQLSEDAFDAIADDALFKAPPSSVSLAPLASDKAVIDLYTSGSSGVPKRVRKTLAQFQTEVATLESLWGKNLEGAHVIATVPHHHIYGLLFRIFWPLSTGRPFDANTCTFPDILKERLAFFQKTILVSSPAHLSRLSSLLTLDSLPFKPHLIFSSGGPLQTSVATELSQAFGHYPIEVFGSTETGGIAWRTQDNNSAWTLMPGTTITHDADDHPCLHSPHLPDNKPWKMDDAVDLLHGGRFMLGSRLDRIVKIEEKRLSLPDMESQLLANAWVESASALALAGRRQTVGMALVLSSEGKKQLESLGKKALIDRFRTHLAQCFEAILLPRKWRFVDALPVDERGKLSMQALATFFENPKRENASPRLLPTVLNVEHDTSKAHAVRLSLHIPRELTYFEGHFPELPILPGVVQLNWVVRYARQHLKMEGHFKSIENLRFQSIILPETTLLLTLAWNDSKHAVDFSMTNGERKCASGRIVFSEAA